MTSLGDFSAFAALRGEGLHPELREFFERAATCPFSSVMVRPDGMLQAGPNPKSEAEVAILNADDDTRQIAGVLIALEIIAKG